MQIFDYSQNLLYEDDSSSMKETIINALKKGTSLHKAYLAELDLSGIDLSGISRGSEVDFSEADFSTANLSRSNLSYCNLHKSNIRGANFSYANLKGADLSEANTVGNKDYPISFFKANIYETNIKGIWLGREPESDIFKDSLYVNS